MREPLAARDGGPLAGVEPDAGAGGTAVEVEDWPASNAPGRAGPGQRGQNPARRSAHRRRLLAVDGGGDHLPLSDGLARQPHPEAMRAARRRNHVAGGAAAAILHERRERCVFLALGQVRIRRASPLARRSFKSTLWATAVPPPTRREAAALSDDTDGPSCSKFPRQPSENDRMLRYRADVRTLVYLTLTTVLTALNWNLGRVHPMLYAATLFMFFTTAVISHNHNHLGMWRSKASNLVTSYLIAHLLRVSGGRLGADAQPDPPQAQQQAGRQLAVAEVVRGKPPRGAPRLSAAHEPRADARTSTRSSRTCGNATASAF